MSNFDDNDSPRVRMVKQWVIAIETIRGRCESPIEEMFFDALIRSGSYQPVADDPAFPYPVLIVYRPDLDKTTHILAIGINVPVRAGGKRYRADLLILAGQRGPAEQLKVVVELDGHDFHDRTPEQASSDRARDRAMQAEGYSVLRFTGSDVHRDVDRAVREVFEFCDRLVAERNADR